MIDHEKQVIFFFFFYVLGYSSTLGSRGLEYTIKCPGLHKYVLLSHGIHSQIFSPKISSLLWNTSSCQALGPHTFSSLGSGMASTPVGVFTEQKEQPLRRVEGVVGRRLMSSRLRTFLESCLFWLPDLLLIERGFTASSRKFGKDLGM